MASRGLTPASRKPSKQRLDIDRAPLATDGPDGHRDIRMMPEWAKDAVAVGGFEDTAELFAARDALDHAGIPYFFFCAGNSRSRNVFYLMTPPDSAPAAEEILEQKIGDAAAEEAYRRHLEELDDRTLLSLNGHGVAEFARGAWREEVERRGLEPQDVVRSELPDDYVAVADFEIARDAEPAARILREAHIPNRVDSVPKWEHGEAVTRVLVPVSLFYRAAEILKTKFSGGETDS